MKKLSVIFATFLLMFLAVGTHSAQAQQRTNVGQLVSGLINVNIGAVNIDASNLITVTDVLNNANINILDNVLNNSPIASNNSNILTNLLQNANIITGNQVVVGVLSGGQLVIQTLPI